MSKENPNINYLLDSAYKAIKLKNFNSQNYLSLFKLNNYTGLILFLGISSINL